MTEGKDAVQRKIDNIYDNHILIAKEGGGAMNSQGKQDMDEQNIFMSNIQEEVRKLHLQLK